MQPAWRRSAARPAQRPAENEALTDAAQAKAVTLPFPLFAKRDDSSRSVGAGRVDTLDPAIDMLANVAPDYTLVPSIRFMGGREAEAIAPAASLSLATSPQRSRACQPRARCPLTRPRSRLLPRRPRGTA